ncbi:MAG: hypothetical protein ACXWCH_31115 [Burkholderiales bacterium]
MELFDGMPERVAQSFDAYLRLGPHRSLDELARVHDAGNASILPSIATLKRWSSRYSWQLRLAAHERIVAARMQAELEEQYERKVHSDLEAIDTAKERFYTWALRDPDDPTLTPAQRRRIWRPTVRDFCNLLKAERLVLGGMKTVSPAPLTTPTQTYTDEELEVGYRAIVRKRHNLPER